MQDSAEIVSESGFFSAKKDRSEVKHALLKRYFDAWLPIISQTMYTPWYVDGFAGPGRYDDDAEGSPILVYTAAVNHILNPKFKRPMQMVFIEIKKKHAKKLRAVLAAKEQELIGKGQDTSKVSYVVRHGKFHEEMETVLNEIQEAEARDRTTVALLAFVDPFGFSGIPMDLMRRIMARTQDAPSELFINIMDGFANRFFNVESHTAAIHALLGTTDWRERILPDGLTSVERIKRFMDIYEEQLGKDLNLFPLKFGMRSEKNRHIYTLLFVTKHTKGLEEMKRAMWKQTQEKNGFQFSEFVQAQGRETPDNFNSLSQVEQKKYFTRVICDMLKEKFRGVGLKYGRDFDEYISRKTIYVFNVKRELKIAMQEFITNRASKFEDIEFDIPNV